MIQLTICPRGSLRRAIHARALQGAAMAQSEHLPIYKRGYELCLYLEQVVRGFSRSNRYGLGDELRIGARRVLSLVVRANSRREREPVLLAVREELEASQTGRRSNSEAERVASVVADWAVAAASERDATLMAIERLLAA